MGFWCSQLSTEPNCLLQTEPLLSCYAWINITEYLTVDITQLYVVYMYWHVLRPWNAYVYLKQEPSEHTSVIRMELKLGHVEQTKTFFIAVFSVYRAEVPSMLTLLALMKQKCKQRKVSAVIQRCMEAARWIWNEILVNANMAWLQFALNGKACTCCGWLSIMMWTWACACTKIHSC